MTIKFTNSQAEVGILSGHKRDITSHRCRRLAVDPALESQYKRREQPTSTAKGGIITCVSERFDSCLNVPVSHGMTQSRACLC
jgi:hypothetical protein